MALLRMLAATLQVQPGEGRPLALLLACSFLLGFSRLLFVTPGISLFLSRFEAGALPYVYIAMALVLPATGFLYDLIERRLTVTVLFSGTIVATSLSLVAFRFLLAFVEGPAVVAALAVWVWAVYVLTGVVFWGAAGRLFDLRQAKRLFGLAGSGEVAAMMIGGLALPLLTSLLGTADLLLVATAALWLWLALLLVLFRSFRPQFSAPRDASSEDEARGKARLPHPLRDRYVALIFGNALVATLAYYLVDTAFLAASQAQYPSADEMTGFLGLFNAGLSALTLLLRTVATNRLINRFGLAFTFLLLPVGVGTGIVALVVAGTTLGAASLIFVLAVLTELLLRVLWDSTHKPTELVLYQPLAFRQRLRAQTFVEGVAEPVGAGIAGVAMLTFGLFFQLDALHLAYLMGLTLVAWLVTSRLPPRQYVAVLSRAVGWRALEVEPGKLMDPASIAVLRRSLASDRVGEAIYSLAMLEKLDPRGFPDHLQQLVSHPSPDMRRYVLERVEALRLAGQLEAARRLAAEDPVVEVRAAAVRTLCSVAEVNALDWVTPYLGDPEARVRASAMTGMLRSCGIEGILRSGQALMRLVASPSVAERRQAAEIVGAVGMGTFYHPLTMLLADEAVEVRRAALQAAGELRNEALWPRLFENLALPAIRDAAISALAAGGEAVLPAVSIALERDGHDPDTRVALLRVGGRVGGPKAVLLLLRHAEGGEEVVRHQALSSLRQCGWRPVESETPKVREWIRREASETAGHTAALLDLEGVDAASLLQAAMRQQIQRQRDRVFLLLTFLYPPEPILQARRSLRGSSVQAHGFGLEILDSVVAYDLKRMVLPLLGEEDLERRLHRLGEVVAPPPLLGSTERLRRIAGRAEEEVTPWMQACALYAVGQLALADLATVVGEATASTDRVVRETAEWAAARLGA